MFERFTDRSRRVVVLSQEIARNLDHDHVGTEHLFAALVEEGYGVAALVLAELGVTRTHFEAALSNQPTASGGHIPFTPRAKKAFEFALREALQMGVNYIGTEHILLGIVRMGEGRAVDALIAGGFDLDAIRTATIAKVVGYQKPHPELPTPTEKVRPQLLTVGALRDALRPFTDDCELLLPIEVYFHLDTARGSRVELHEAGPTNGEHA